MDVAPGSLPDRAARLDPGPHLAPAKVNLALHVTGRRADGYHLLSSLVAFATVGDRLTLAPTDAEGFTLAGPFAGALGSSLAPGGPNSVTAALDAVRAVAAAHAARIAPVHATLGKHLPVASGIGGGSADAAAVVRLAVAALPALEPAFRRAAEAIGADVPMCVDSRAARVAGIGETVEPIGGFPRVDAVLVNPGVPVSTPAVFRALTHRDNPAMADAASFRDLDDLVGFLRATRNDLEAPAIGIAPAIADALRALRGENAAFARMSGSGATVFGLFASEDAARQAAAVIGAARPGWWVVATALGSPFEAHQA